MSMPDHIILSNSMVTGFTRIFCQKGLSCSWKTAKLDCFVLPEWENPHTYRKYLSHFESWQRGPGGGVMTLHDYGYLPPEVLKSYHVSE